MKWLYFYCGYLLFTLTLEAYPALLWQITDPKQPQQKHWLLASIHTKQQRFLQFSPVVLRCLQQASILYTESDMSYSQAGKYQSYLTSKKHVFKQLLPRSKYQLWREKLRQHPYQLSWQQFSGKSILGSLHHLYGRAWGYYNYYQPSSFASSFYSMDQKLYALAKKYHLTTKYLENASEHYGGFQRIAKKKQALYLLQGIITTARKPLYLGQLGVQLMQAFHTANLTAIAKNSEQLVRFMAINNAGYLPYVNYLITERNQKMATKIAKIIQKKHTKSCLFVIGCSHFVNRHNLLNLLKKEGFNIVPIQ